MIVLLVALRVVCCLVLLLGAVAYIAGCFGY